jgi:hypothetical protein
MGQSVVTLSASSALTFRRHKIIQDSIDSTNYATENQSFIHHEVDLKMFSQRGLFSVKENEVLEIWFDERVVAKQEIIDRLELHPGGKWNDNDAFYELQEILEAENLPCWEMNAQQFSGRPVIINGELWLALEASIPVFIRLDIDGSWPEPRSGEVWGSFGICEWDSRVSGFDFNYIGTACPGVVLRHNTYDWQEPESSIEITEEDKYPGIFAAWLLTDEYDFTGFKALLYIEQQMGEMPLTTNVFADWIIEDWSSTMQMDFSGGFPTPEQNKAVLGSLFKDVKAAAYARGITHPNSPEGIARKSRHEAYYAVRNMTL